MKEYNYIYDTILCNYILIYTFLYKEDISFVIADYVRHILSLPFPLIMMNKATANLLCQWMTLKDQQHHHIHIIIENVNVTTPTHQQQRCQASLRAVKRKTTTDTFVFHHTTQHNQQPSHNNASIQHLNTTTFTTSTIHYSSYHIITFNITMSYDNNDDCFCWWLYCIIASHQLFQ